MTVRLHRRWMLALAGFTLAVAALFGLFAMTFVYAVEDRFLDRLLLQEAERQRAHLQTQGHYDETTPTDITLHLNRLSLPADLARSLAAEPQRREFPGDEGRHYHLLPLDQPGQAPWLVAEVSRQLIVRPMRDGLLRWLAVWGLAAVALAMALGWWLARRVTGPLETLAQRVAAAKPERLPEGVAQGLGDDEIGAVGRAFDTLLARTRAFVEREQAFTRDASHELRTPLAVLRLSIERLQADAALPAPTHDTLAAMHAATQLMQQTVQTLLLMAREDSTRKDTNPSVSPVEPVALLPLLEHWVLAHAGWLDRQALRLDIALTRHDRLPLPGPVLQLALASLLGNAFAHGRPGGRVRVACERGALVVHNPGPAADRRDSAGGTGVTAGEGFGLGLSILRRLLESHGGRLQLVHLDGGTTATVSAGPDA